MRGWRSKLIFLLIVYFAGFATAIYCLAPAPEKRTAQSVEKSFTPSAFKSDEFAKSVNTGIRKCIDFSKDAARRVAELVKQKYDNRHQNDG